MYNPKSFATLSAGLEALPHARRFGSSDPRGGLRGMNIVILWTGVTAPMAACWRALAATPGVRLTVLSELHRHAQTAYDEPALLAGIDHHLRYSDEPLDRTALVERIAALRPEAMIVLGWRSEMCRAAAESPALAAVPKILAFDMPFAVTLRKLFAPLVLARYVRRFAAAFVPGERSAEYARWLGFREPRIERGLMAADTALLAEADRQRLAAAAYPRKFLYVGRYTAEKGIATLMAGYRRYRAAVANPWPLSCCGMGPEGRQLAGEEGVCDLGFVQPERLPAVYAEHGAFVIASRYDPWPFVLLEAAASGLPVVCTAACGNHVELVRDRVTGRVCRPGNAAALAEALRWIHDREASLPEIGSRSRALVEPYSTAQWAARVLRVAGTVTR